MKTNETQIEQTEIRAALWEQYQYEQANETGFFAPSEWNKGQRNFAAFCAAKRVAGDFDKALKLIGATI
jgi:hypothetical protein